MKIKEFFRSAKSAVRSTNNKGMTLIEIMVVITIMGVIAAMVTVNVMGNLEKAKIKTAATLMKSVEQALETYHLDNGGYPSTDQGLSALVDSGGGGSGDAKRFQPGGYLKGGKIPKDPWGKELSYISPGSQGQPYEIISSGPDKQEGTDDDIKSSE
ncbi:MAG: type II secretion system major pseudopilin GspG [Deltaproteobacteria bacterium]|nr:type II secretion system major pseudopilin GspG [Deltaproteobacteria bacterium]